MEMRNIIGIVNVTSGSSAYPATYFLKEYYSFSAKNSLPVPKIIIDNVTDIENKSTAYIDNQQSNTVVRVLGNALEDLIALKSDKVAILCNICHLYTDGIYRSFPAIRPFFIDVVSGIVVSAKTAGVKKILILCSENARKSQMFDNYFFDADISTFYADKEQHIIHSLMDAAEQNNIDDRMILELYNLCLSYKNHAICFACTELSMIYGHDKEMFTEFTIFDSIIIAIKQLSDAIKF